MTAIGPGLEPLEAATGAGTAVYVHVPFCVVKCGYCDFNSYTVEDRTALDRFLDALERELAQAHLPGAPVSLFVGGGTPTFLDPPRFRRLFEVLARFFDLAACPEVSVEANPESVTDEKAAIAREAGVDRVSVGAQSFDPRRLRFLDRAHDTGAIGRAVVALRGAGFENLGLDLMFALPGQGPGEWAEDLERAIELRPDHLSCYNLTFEPGTRLHRDRARGRVAEAGEELQRELFLHTRRRLQEAGFTAYEISNFAGRGGPCRHNDHYWLQGDYVGVGPGAAGHRAGVRTTNLKALAAWAEAVEAGVPPVGHAETLSPDQRWGEALWLGLRRTAGVDLERVAARLDRPLPAGRAVGLERLEAEGRIRREGARVRLTGEGVLDADGVALRLL